MSLTVPTKITTPKGIDYPIQALQTYLGNNLSWLTHSFGRVVKNETKEGSFLPEVYTGDNEYLQMLPDDGVNSMCFFDVDDSINIENRTATANVRIVFYINLAKCFTSLTHRADENAIVDIYQLLKSYAHGWEVENINKVAKNIFSEYNYEQSWLDDLQPYFVCSFECSLTFNYINSNCY